MNPAVISVTLRTSIAGAITEVPADSWGTLVTKEITVEDHLVDVCERNGAWAPKGEICAGFPDRIVLALVARVCFVETKTVDGTVSKIQKRIHKALRALGHDVEILWTRAQVDAWAERYFG